MAAAVGKQAFLGSRAIFIWVIDLFPIEFRFEWLCIVAKVIQSEPVTESRSCSAECLTASSMTNTSFDAREFAQF